MMLWLLIIIAGLYCAIVLWTHWIGTVVHKKNNNKKQTYLAFVRITALSTFLVQHLPVSPSCNIGNTSIDAYFTQLYLHGNTSK